MEESRFQESIRRIRNIPDPKAMLCDMFSRHHDANHSTELVSESQFYIKTTDDNPIFDGNMEVRLDIKGGINRQVNNVGVVYLLLRINNGEIYQTWLNYHDTQNRTVMESLSSQPFIHLCFVSDTRQKRFIFFNINLIDLLSAIINQVKLLPEWNEESFLDAWNVQQLKYSPEYLWEVFGSAGHSIVETPKNQNELPHMDLNIEFESLDRYGPYVQFTIHSPIEIDVDEMELKIRSFLFTNRNVIIPVFIFKINNQYLYRAYINYHDRMGSTITSSLKGKTYVALKFIYPDNKQSKWIRIPDLGRKLAEFAEDFDKRCWRLTKWNNNDFITAVRNIEHNYTVEELWNAYDSFIRIQ